MWGVPQRPHIANTEGGPGIIVKGTAWLLLRAIRVTDEHLMRLLAPFGGDYPATDQQYTADCSPEKNGTRHRGRPRKRCLCAARRKQVPYDAHRRTRFTAATHIYGRTVGESSSSGIANIQSSWGSTYTTTSPGETWNDWGQDNMSGADSDKVSSVGETPTPAGDPERIAGEAF